MKIERIEPPELRKLTLADARRGDWVMSIGV